MVDVASIVIAVISLVGSVAATVIAGLVTLHRDEKKRASETQKLISKYKDPLLLATQDLQNRLRNILEDNFLAAYYNDSSRLHLIIEYTAYLIGQYFSWIYIFRRKAQFLCFSLSRNNKSLSDTIIAIQYAFSTDKYDPGERLFTLWRPEQMAIGEIMTVEEDEELYCMKYSAFTKIYDGEDPTFRNWFNPITEGIQELAEIDMRKDSPVANRLRRVQHLLVDLINILDPEHLSQGGSRLGRVRPAAPSCRCSRCSTAEQHAAYK